MDTRPGNTTPTDSRSQRIRASRKGGHLLTRARGSSNRPACPCLRVPSAPVPDGRTIRPGPCPEPAAGATSFIPLTNPIESVFASVRLRTNVAKRARNRENALYLVFKIVQRLSRGWRSLNGDPILTQALLAGVVFKDGLIQAQSQQSRTKEVVAA